MSSKLFSFGDVKNHPHRSGFDLSRRICFTSKAGELLPVYYKLVFPGDKFQLRHQLFTRTQPVNTAAYTRIREYLDWYFVPIRLINKNLPQALTFMQDNPVLASGITTNKTVTNDIPWTVLGKDNNKSALANLLSLMYQGDGSNGLDPVVNFFGFNAGTLGTKLLMMLRYGNFIPSVYNDSNPGGNSFGLSRSNLDLRADDSSYAVNILPLAAYQKIYADHFRFTQWEKNEAYTYNFDWYTGGNVFANFAFGPFDTTANYLKSNNLLTLRYANWPKDLFMGVMPNSQLGDVSVVPLTGSVAQADILGVKHDGTGAPVGNFVNVTTTLSGQTSSQAADLKLGVYTGGSVSNPNQYASSGVYKLVTPAFELSSSFNVLQLRMAEAVQKFREVSQVADQTARAQIYAHFGVTLSPALSDTSFRIGGSVSNIDISEVVNNNLTENFDANIQGKGIGTGQGFENFSSDEYGILMAIYHVSPILDYVITGQTQELLYVSTKDLPIPEFDSIGMQSLHFGRFSNSFGFRGEYPPVGEYTKQVMGYVPRYVDLKTDYDEVYGAFRTTLKSWVSPLDPEYVKDWMVSSSSVTGDTLSLNYGFFKVNPRVLDSIFAVKCDDTVDTDQFLTSLYLDIKAVRNFDYDGMPY